MRTIEMSCCCGAELKIEDDGKLASPFWAIGAERNKYAAEVYVDLWVDMHRECSYLKTTPKEKRS